MQQARLFELHGSDWSLILEQEGNSVPIWRHFGARVDTIGIPTASSTRGSSTFSLDHDPPIGVFPTSGAGWFGPPTLALRNLAGQPIDVQFSNCTVVADKDWLELQLTDEVAKINLQIDYRIRAGAGLEITSTIKNLRSNPICVERIASAVAPLSAQLDKIISWNGRHNSELAECREPMPLQGWYLSLIHISEPTRRVVSRMPSSA